MSCKHLGLFTRVTPSADGCEECLKIGQQWVHLRICRVCGHVGCCDQSIGRHATKHFHASGHPVTIKGTSKTKPIKTTVTVTFAGSTIACSYKATTVKGTSSNTGNTITFSKQKFTAITGPPCPASASFSATFGPVKDTSVSGSPKVFVN